MPSFFAKASSAGISEMATFSRPFSVAVPPLPGATNTFCTRGLCASFHAIACSRPPLPMTRSFMSVPEVAHAGEDHRRTAFIRRGDHLCVAHAAAGLDEGSRARVEEDFNAVAKGEEGIRGGNTILKIDARCFRL